VSKWYLVNGALDRGQVALLAALLLSTILNAGYFVPIFYRAFFLAPAEGVDLGKFKEAPLAMVAPLVLTSAASVALGLFPQIFQAFVKAFGSY
jgi:multicomponent Na+:H+ antiporter subunit D